MNKQILAIFLMCCVQFGFGGYSVILEVYGKGHINPVVFSLFRDSCAFPILLIAAALIEGIRFPKMKDLPLFLSMGFIGIFGNQVLFILGLYAAGADIASIFQPSTPVLTVIVALVVGVERMPLLCGRKKDDRRQQDDGRSMVSGWLKIGGIILVFAGGCVMVITAPKKNATKTNAIFLGEVLLLLNCLCMACYVLIQKKYIFNNNASDTWKHTPINVTAWSYMFGAIFMSIASIYCALTQEGVFDLFPQSLPPCHSRKLNVTITNTWCDAHSGTNYNSTVKQLCECDTVDYGSFLIPLSYAAFISSSMAYGFITIANKYLPSTVVTAFWPMQVPAAVTLNYLVNSKTITIGQGLGGLLIIIALFAVVYADSRERKKIEERKDGLLNLYDEDLR